MPNGISLFFEKNGKFRKISLIFSSAQSIIEASRKRGRRIENTKTLSLGMVAATVCALADVAAPKGAMAASQVLLDYAEGVFNGKKADRIFMYNPDAIGAWLYAKYPNLLKSTVACTDVALPLCSEQPTVTPVNFASMYTGLTPKEHGIQKYERPVLTCETIFDTFLKAGKRVAIVSANTCTFAKIFAERELDYYPCSTIEELHAVVARLIIEDKHDLIAIHAWNYDSVMHKFGPESPEALGELRLNDSAYGSFDTLIREYWKDHNVFMGFAMDHGCHEIDAGGSHGLDMPEDTEIIHFYKAYAAQISQ